MKFLLNKSKICGKKCINWTKFISNIYTFDIVSEQSKLFPSFLDEMIELFSADARHFYGNITSLVVFDLKQYTPLGLRVQVKTLPLNNGINGACNHCTPSTWPHSNNLCTKSILSNRTSSLLSANKSLPIS